MRDERRRFTKLIDRIYTRYSMEYEISVSLIVTQLTSYFSLFVVLGQAVKLKLVEHLSWQTIFSESFVLLMLATLFTLIIVMISLVLEVIIRKLTISKSEASIKFNKYLRTQLSKLYKSGKIESYEIGRFYLVDSLVNRDIDYNLIFTFDEDEDEDEDEDIKSTEHRKNRK